MTDLVSMPIKIIPYLRTTIEEIGSKEEADFALYHLGFEWGKETVELSGEKSDLENLKTKTVLTAIHSGITKLDVEVEDSIDITPYDSNIEDDQFLAGFCAGVVSGLLDEYHVSKIKNGYFTIKKSEKQVKGDIFRKQRKDDRRISLENLKEGGSYLIEDDAKEGHGTFNTFSDALKKGMTGLCFTRTFPSKIREEFPELEFPIFWLSTVEGTDKIKTIKPENFCQQTKKISSAFFKVNNGIVMLHGIEFLLSYISFEEVLKTIQEVQDINSIEKGIFLLAADPKTIKKDQLNRLKEEMEFLEI